MLRFFQSLREGSESRVVVVMVVVDVQWWVAVRLDG